MSTTAPVSARIRTLLEEGKTAREVIALGFKAGSVYKAQRRLRRESAERAAPGRVGSTAAGALAASADALVESDAEVQELKVALRKAQLKRQLAEVSGPAHSESRLQRLETAAQRLERALAEAHASIAKLERRAADSPLFGIRDGFRCSCGSAGLVSAQVACAACGREASYGWWPERSR